MEKITELFIASHNKGKIKELELMFNPYGITIKSPNDIPYPETDETGVTFEENAILKAKDGAKFSNMPTIADDSGVCIKALNDEPGVYSARYKGGYKTVLNKLAELNNSPTITKIDRSAYFVCTIAFTTTNGEIYTFRGESHGKITKSPKGEGGFGYDPIFIPNSPQGETRSYAEMTKQEKAQTSHRKKALQQFLDFLNLEK